MENNKIFPVLDVFYNIEAKNFENLIVKLMPHLSKNNLVVPEFATNIIKREKDYPTALAFNQINIAIPHTDAIYVKKTGLVVIKLQKAITMTHMATSNTQLEVKYLFLLLVKDAHKQIDFLTSLIEKFKNQQFIKALQKVKNKDALIELINKGDQ